MEGRRERMQSRKQGGRAQSRPGSGSRPAATRNRAASLGEVTPPPKKKKKTNHISRADYQSTAQSDVKKSDVHL